MQTPLQILIEKLKQRQDAGYELELTDSDDSMIQINLAIRDATELLEKEREVIIESAQYGFSDALRPFSEQCTSFEDYFTKTFTDESK